MLSGEILEELVRVSHVRDDLLLIAWPSLSVESKLQILDALQKNTFVLIPSQVFELAGSDPNPIVRLWVCRYQQVSEVFAAEERSYDKVKNAAFSLPAPSAKTLEVAKNLTTDKSPLVREIARLDVDIFKGPVEPLSNRQRLLGARYGRKGDLVSAIEWIEGLIRTSAVADDDLCLVVSELVRSPWINEYLKTDGRNGDGMTHFSNVKTGKKLWELAKKLPDMAHSEIGYYAPIIVEKTNIVVEVFDKLPIRTQAAVIGRQEQGSEQIAALVRLNPNQYDKSVTEALATHDKYVFEMSSQEERRKSALLASNDKLLSLLEMSIELEKKINDLKSETGPDVQSTRKGFFGILG